MSIDIPRPLTNDLWIGLFHFKCKGWSRMGTRLCWKLLFKLLLFRYLDTNHRGAVGCTQKGYTSGRTLRCEFEPCMILFLLICCCLLVLWHFLVLELLNAVFLVFLYCFFLFVLFQSSRAWLLLLLDSGQSMGMAVQPSWIGFSNQWLCSLRSEPLSHPRRFLVTSWDQTASPPCINCTYSQQFFEHPRFTSYNRHFDDISKTWKQQTMQ